MKVIFMGTPAFAIPALTALINSKHEILAVYTRGPKPSGRGKKEHKTPVHELAEQNNIPVKTPGTLKITETQKELIELGADVVCVAAYGLILPDAVLNGVKHGCINVHPSLLPRWRGAAPIQRAVMAGDKETGACIMQMDRGLDEGDVLLEEIIPMPEKITAGALHDELAKLGAKLLLQTLDMIEKGEAKRFPQFEQGVTYAQKITKEDERIDWRKSAEEIEMQIRGLNPAPGSHFIHNEEKIKIFMASAINESHSFLPGQVVDENLKIACGDGFLQPEIIQRPGKNKVKTKELLCGFKINKGEILA